MNCNISSNAAWDTNRGKSLTDCYKSLNYFATLYKILIYDIEVLSLNRDRDYFYLG